MHVCIFYQASLVEADDEMKAIQESRAREISSWQRDLILCISLTVPLGLIKLISGFFSNPDGESNFSSGAASTPTSTFGSVSWSVLLMWVLSTPVQFFVGKRFYTKAWYGLRAGCSLGMDFLVASGTTFSYGYSVVSVLVRFHCLIPPESTKTERILTYAFECLRFSCNFCEGWMCKSVVPWQTLLRN